MALTRTQKEDQLQELLADMEKASSVIFAHYIGMSVANVSALRGSLRQGDAKMKVAKKTLMRIAAEKQGLPALSDDMLDGPVACIFSFADPLSGAQIAFKFAKKNPQVELIGGIFEGKLLTKKQAMDLAQIPGKLQLLSMFASMCNGPLTSFARGLSEIAKQKEAPAPKEEAKAPEVTAPVAEAPVAEPAPAAAEPMAESPAPEAATDAPATDTPSVS